MSEVSTSTAWQGYTRMDPAQIETLAWQILDGAIYGSWDVPPNVPMSRVFFALSFLQEGDLVELQQRDVAHWYAPLAESGPRDIDGLPFFLEHRWLDRHDAEAVQARVEELAAARRHRSAT